MKKYFLTIKSKGEQERHEWEREIPKWTFDLLWKEVETRIISKTRYLIDENERMLEIDFYHGSLEGLIILECEFNNVHSAKNFVPPQWLGETIDVTHDPMYKNRNIAKK